MHLQKTADGKTLATLIPGDGIGPECVESARRIIDAAGAKLEWEVRHAGESVFKQGVQSGVPQDTIESIRKTRLVLKGPLGTPVGYGEKSANVTLRKLFETYGNIRPVRELPGVKTPYSGRGIDLVVVRENVEDLYAGIEHMQTPGVAQCLKLISAKGCEKIVRLAFELARAEGRKSVACATKSNIMKFTEGTLKRTFERIAKEYSDIESWHVIIDNACHQLVKKPEQFDVIVTTNMNGDIMSDLTSALVGGLGFAPSANLGNDAAIFEAVHGSAPKYAGKNCINPAAVIGSAIMMLRYIGDFEAANKIENAMLVTWEDGKVMTGDVVGYDKGCTTTGFTDAIIGNLGRTPKNWKVRNYKPINMPKVSSDQAFVKVAKRRTLGFDYFIETSDTPAVIGPKVQAIAEGTPFALKMISNRGTQVFPDKGSLTDCTDQHRCRFIARDKNADVSDADILALIQKASATYRWAHIEKLQEFDGQPGYTKAQGED
ncbi:MAG: NADP-dependent isocitrate dehydrogenase [Gemmataceae bacterium]|nr:NADP-dependent isocitrate dehydrogenase [Gemmataceae bacterium]